MRTAWLAGLVCATSVAAYSVSAQQDEGCAVWDSRTLRKTAAYRSYLFETGHERVRVRKSIEAKWDEMHGHGDRMLQAIDDLSTKSNGRETQIYASAVASLLFPEGGSYIDFQLFCENNIDRILVITDNKRGIRVQNEYIACPSSHESALFSNKQPLLHLADEYINWIIFIIYARIKESIVLVSDKELERLTHLHRQKAISGKHPSTPAMQVLGILDEALSLTKSSESEGNPIPSWTYWTAITIMYLPFIRHEPLSEQNIQNAVRIMNMAYSTPKTKDNAQESEEKIPEKKENKVLLRLLPYSMQVYAGLFEGVSSQMEAGKEKLRVHVFDAKRTTGTDSKVICNTIRIIKNAINCNLVAVRKVRHPEILQQFIDNFMEIFKDEMDATLSTVLAPLNIRNVFDPDYLLEKELVHNGARSCPVYHCKPNKTTTGFRSRDRLELHSRFPKRQFVQISHHGANECTRLLWSARFKRHEKHDHDGPRNRCRVSKLILQKFNHACGCGR